MNYPSSDKELEDYIDRSVVDSSLFEHEQLVNYYVDRNDWTEASKLIDRLFRDSPERSKANKRIIQFKFAQNLEQDEDFEAALKSYELSGTEIDNAARIIIKRDLDESFRSLGDYCSTRTSLRNFWSEYESAHQSRNNKILIGTGDAKKKNAKEDSITYYLSHASLTKRKAELTKDLSLPKQLGEFFDNSNHDKWSNKRILDVVKTIGDSLNPSTRSVLAEIATLYKHTNSLAEVCDLYLCFNLSGAIIDSVSEFLDPVSSMRVVCHLGEPDNLALNLIDYLSQNQNKIKSFHGKKPTGKNQLMFSAYLNSGLIDEALQLFIMDSSSQDEQTIGQALEYLEKIVESKDPNRLETIDPEIQSSTMMEVQRFLSRNDQVSASYVITVVVLSLDIFLLKLGSSSIDVDTRQMSMPKLEIMFKRLGDCLKGLNFNASDGLIWATNSLVGTLKEQLDAIADSEITRESFKLLVETVAGRCMVESRYKSAAALYSQIGDNMSAIKSLMRLGDMDIVINFSLLVRDLVVSRLTVNYLKHLNADPAIIEDFIAKSRS